MSDFYIWIFLFVLRLVMMPSVKSFWRHQMSRIDEWSYHVGILLGMSSLGEIRGYHSDRSGPEEAKKKLEALDFALKDIAEDFYKPSPEYVLHCKSRE